jgi:hypothetical protein
MDIDIEIYINRLKDFFSNDESARKDIFGDNKVDMSKFYNLAHQQAVINHQKVGDPTLSTIQLMEIMADLAFNEVITEHFKPNILSHNKDQIDRLFYKPLGDYPPVCLN